MSECKLVIGKKEENDLFFPFSSFFLFFSFLSFPFFFFNTMMFCVKDDSGFKRGYGMMALAITVRRGEATLEEMLS